MWATADRAPSSNNQVHQLAAARHDDPIWRPAVEDDAPKVDGSALSGESHRVLGIERSLVINGDSTVVRQGAPGALGGGAPVSRVCRKKSTNACRKCKHCRWLVTWGRVLASHASTQHLLASALPTVVRTLRQTQCCCTNRAWTPVSAMGLALSASPSGPRTAPGRGRRQTLGPWRAAPGRQAHVRPRRPEAQGSQHSRGPSPRQPTRPPRLAGTRPRRGWGRRVRGP